MVRGQGRRSMVAVVHQRCNPQESSVIQSALVGVVHLEYAGTASSVDTLYAILLWRFGVIVVLVSHNLWWHEHGRQISKTNHWVR
jgi:hypothetical protein